MAVAITCGYGGYLLPLLAAHSSLFIYLFIFINLFKASYQADADQQLITGLIPGLLPANERWRYFLMASLIGWVQA